MYIYVGKKNPECHDVCSGTKQRTQSTYLISTVMLHTRNTTLFDFICIFTTYVGNH